MLEFERELQAQAPSLPHGGLSARGDPASPACVSVDQAGATEDVHAAMQHRQRDSSEAAGLDGTHSDGCEGSAAASDPVAAAAMPLSAVDAVHHTPSGLERLALFEQYRQDEERRQVDKERKHEESESQAQLRAAQEEVGERARFGLILS